MANGIDVMTAQDFEEVTALWRQVDMWPHTAEDRDWFEHAIARTGDCALVWRDGARVVGTAMGAWDGLRGWIYRLAVAQHRQDHGIGSALLAAAEQRLRARGARQINLMIYEENPRAEAFYIRRGYERSPVKVLRKRFLQGETGHTAER